VASIVTEEGRVGATGKKSKQLQALAVAATETEMATGLVTAMNGYCYDPHTSSFSFTLTLATLH